MSHEMNTHSVSPAKHALPRLIGLSILASLIVFAVLIPLIWGIDSVEQDFTTVLSGPVSAHPLGTDDLGRDMLARLAVAVRLSLGLALGIVITAIVPGILLGLLAAWNSGVIDKCLSLLAEVFLALPGLVLILLLVAISPGNVLMLYGALALVLWTEYFRKTRALSRMILASPTVSDSRLQGLGPFYVIRRHLWPALSSMLMTVSALGAASAIMVIATLGFLGLGVRTPTAELGVMISQLLPYYSAGPFSFGLPILVLFLMVLSLVLIGGGRKP